MNTILAKINLHEDINEYLFTMKKVIAESVLEKGKNFLNQDKVDAFLI